AQGTTIHIVVASAWDDRAEGTRLRDEAQACADELGATLTWRGVPSFDWVCSTAHLDRLDVLIGSVQADALFIPWLLDSPPSHRLTNQILAASVHRSRPHFDVSLWAYQVHNAILATSWVDISNDIDAKVDLIRKYRSQVEGGRR